MRNWLFITSVVIVSLFWPNESGSEDFGSFWHITDPHIDPNYSCQGALGNYECDSPLSLWTSALNNTKRLSLKPPDFVIFSGDSVAHDESLSRAKFLDVMRSAAQRLRSLFPDQQIPIIPVLGNHDTHPANVFEVDSESAATEARRRWCGLLASDRDLWADWIAAGLPDPAANATRNSLEVFTSGCFFSRRLHIDGGPSLVLISVNGMLWYSHNRKANSSLSDPAGQFAWLESTLSQARESNSKVLLICHFPPGATENSPTKYRHFFDNYNQRFLGLLRKNTDILIGGLFAHQHTDTFRVLKEEEEPALPLLFGPSISPWRLGGLGAFNPRVRIFHFTRSSLRLADYQQLYLNLSAAAQPAWALEYSFRAEYRLPDTSAASLSALLVDFAHSEGNWSRYWQHQLGGLPHTSGACPPLGSVRRCRHLCAMFYLEYAELDRCLEGCAAGRPLSELLPSAFSADGGLPSTVRGDGTDAAAAAAAATTDQWSPLPITVVVIVVFLAILLGVVLLVNRELCRRRRCDRGGHSLFNANQNGYFGCSAAEAAGRGDIERFPPSLSASRLSSLDDVGGDDGGLEVHTDEGTLIQSGDGDRQTPLGRFSGLVRFSRTGHGVSCPDKPINSISAAARTKFGAFMEPTYPQLAYMSAGGGGSLRRATPSSDITDERGEVDEGVEEGDYNDDDYGDEEDNLELGMGYDAEGEEEEDFFFRPPPAQPFLVPPLSAPAATNGSGSSSNRASVNPKPLKDLLPPRLNNGNCLRTTPTPTSVAPPRKGHHHQSANSPSTQDEARDLSDAESYSLHSSLPYLHPAVGGGGGTRGSSTSPDVVLASSLLLPTCQSASGAFGYTTAPSGTTTAHTTGDSCDSTVDGETPPSDSLGGGSLASPSSSSSAVMSKPQRLLSTTTASSGERSGLLPTQTSASVASSPVIRAPPSGRSLPAAAEVEA